MTSALWDRHQVYLQHSSLLRFSCCVSMYVSLSLSLPLSDCRSVLVNLERAMRLVGLSSTCSASVQNPQNWLKDTVLNSDYYFECSYLLTRQYNNDISHIYILLYYYNVCINNWTDLINPLLTDACFADEWLETLENWRIVGFRPPLESSLTGQCSWTFSNRHWRTRFSDNWWKCAD